jgi:hypothetical protein
MSTQALKNYDSITFFQWLWWRIRCLEATPTEFQSLFEKIAQRAREDFIKIRPYGKIGDRKCDGLFWGNGTVFQVYSPDWLKQSETVAKIEEDLDGAVAQWGSDLKKWVFVYNTRLGLGPDVPQILYEQKRKYPDIIIEPLSSEGLWELLRNEFTIQQRAEILGAPSGYEQIFMLPGVVPEEIEKRLKEGRFVVIHDLLSPIDIQDAVKALEPDKPFGPPFYIRVPSYQESWEITAQFQSKIVEEALQKGKDLLPRFAVFSLSPIPLAIHLGYLFSDRVEVKPFQYDRERMTWCWDSERNQYDVEFHVQGIPSTPITEPADVIIRVSLSASIAPLDSVKAVGDCPVQVDLSVSNPDVMWLCHPEQLTFLGRIFRDILKNVNQMVPQCTGLHLFYAGPTGGAIVLGQAINPNICPKVFLYQYERKKEPRYQFVLTLE